MTQYFFTADEHYDHKNVIKYCNRPFSGVEEMNAALIANHNSVVGEEDVVFHLGDFTLVKRIDRVHKEFIDKLNGQHIFVKGSHDYWIPFKTSKQILELNTEGYHIVLCHYAMRVWPRSHFNSWQLYGHSHGKLPPMGKQHDVGVDNNNYFPVSFEQIKQIMETREDNFNLVKKRGANEPL